MLGRARGLASRGALAALARPRRVPGPARAAPAAAVPVPAVAVPAAVLPAAPDAAGAAVQPAPAAAAVLAAAAAGPAGPARRVAGQGAPVRAVRAAGAGLRLRAGGAARALAELVAGARAGGLAGRARRLRGPAARRAQLHHARHAARLRPQEHRAHGERAGRGAPGLIATCYCTYRVFIWWAEADVLYRSYFVFLSSSIRVDIRILIVNS